MNTARRCRHEVAPCVVIGPPIAGAPRLDVLYETSGVALPGIPFTPLTYAATIAGVGYSYAAELTPAAGARFAFAIS